MQALQEFERELVALLIATKAFKSPEEAIIVIESGILEKSAGIVLDRLAKTLDEKKALVFRTSVAIRNAIAHWYFLTTPFEERRAGELTDEVLNLRVHMRAAASIARAAGKKLGVSDDIRAAAKVAENAVIEQRRAQLTVAAKSGRTVAGFLRTWLAEQQK